MDATLTSISGTQIGAWITSVLATAGAVMALRRKGSSDAKERAKDTAETNYFGTAIGSITADRDMWKERALESDRLLAKANETIARMTALHEARESDIAELRAQIGSLRQLVVQFAPPDLKDALSQSLVAVAPKKGKA